MFLLNCFYFLFRVALTNQKKMLNASYQNGTLFQEPSRLDISEYLDFEKFVKYFIPVIFGLLVLFGIIGNTIVIYLISFKEKLNQPTNILIFFLALADLLFVLSCVPYTAVHYALSQWPFGSIWCKVVNFITHVCAYASVWTLVLLSLDRYIAVVHPMVSKRIRTRRNTFLIVYATWAIIICGNIPVLLQFGVIRYQWEGFNRSACLNLAGLYSKYVLKVFYGCFFIFGYVFPLTLICMLYGSLVKHLRLRTRMSLQRHRRSMRAKRQVTRMIISFVTAFALCWLPIHAVLITQNFIDFEATIGSTAVMMFANCLAYINSCINPILYVFLSKKFQKNFRSCLPKSRSLVCIKMDQPRRDTKETVIISCNKEINDIKNTDTV